MENKKWLHKILNILIYCFGNVSLVYTHYGQININIGFILSVMLGAFFTLLLFIILTWKGLEQICDEMFEKIEQQSESKLILDQLEESLLIT